MLLFFPHWFRYVVVHCCTYCNFYDQMLHSILPAECRCIDFICKGKILFGGNQTNTITAKKKYKRSSDMTTAQLQWGAHYTCKSSQTYSFSKKMVVLWALKPSFSSKSRIFCANSLIFRLSLLYLQRDDTRIRFINGLTEDRHYYRSHLKKKLPCALKIFA